MRIISGTFGSRIIQAPSKASVHPMSERMRGALFNMLGDLNARTFLDAFAGSGAVGLEALSRGAVSATFIENDKLVLHILEDNVRLLGADDRASIITANVFGWAEKSTDEFDVVVADPPYDRVDPKKVVDKLKNHINASGIMVLSHTGRAEPPRVDGVVVVETRSYANGTLAFYRTQ